MEPKMTANLSKYNYIKLVCENNTDPNKGNALTILTRGVDNYVMGWDYKHKEMEEDIKKIQRRFNTCIYLINFDIGFLEAHENVVKELGDKLDFFYSTSHGSPYGIMLSEQNLLTNDELNFMPSLNKFYKKDARGVVSACSTADPNIRFNFAQILANKMGIPIEGLKEPANGYLADDLHLEFPWTRRNGFDSNSSGTFESTNGKEYGIKMNEDGTYEVYSVSGINGRFELPSDFNPSRVTHFDTTPTRSYYRNV